MREDILNFVKQRCKYWWTSLLAGISAIALGIWCLVAPSGTLIALTYVFVAAFFVCGISDIVFAVSNRRVYYGWGWTLAGGFIDILLGILLLALPQPFITTLLIYFIGFWILFRSIWTIGIAAELYGFINAGWLLALGILSLLFSFLYLFSPVFGGVVIVTLASLAFMFYGIFRISYAFQLKSINKRIKEFKG